MSTLTLTYTLSETQFMQAARVLWSYRAIGERGNWIVVIACLAAGPALLINAIPTGWLLLAVAAFFAAFTALRSLIWRRAYRKTERYTAPISATFEAEKITTTTAIGTETLPWRSLKSYAETPDYLFLFGPRRALFILPKSALPVPDDIEQLRDMITAVHLPRKKMRWT